MPLVSIVMGSESDRPFMQGASEILQKMGIEFELVVTSAHRSPARTNRYIQYLQDQKIEVVIAGAGAAAHLAGAIASKVNIPVIGVPLATTPLNGFDSLLSMVQMPSGVPVATMSIGPTGAKNAAVFAVQILARKYRELRPKLEQYKKELAGDESEAI